MSVPKPKIAPPPERVRTVEYLGERHRPPATLTRRLLAEHPEVDMAAVLGRRGYRARWRLAGEAEQTATFGPNKRRAELLVEALQRRHGEQLAFAVVESRLESPWEPLADAYRSKPRADQTQPPAPKEQRP
ncbi:hypothetical protein [Desertimonas flava]|uniref:hypothetical protein n=1 Tax=Desertimonas flava TaxID=2064846 RepID=UPI0013C4EA16|nr:hypothetical protein [Desertimonas flava]